MQSALCSCKEAVNWWCDFDATRIVLLLHHLTDQLAVIFYLPASALRNNSFSSEGFVFLPSVDLERQIQHKRQSMRVGHRTQIQMTVESLREMDTSQSRARCICEIRTSQKGRDLSGDGMMMILRFFSNNMNVWLGLNWLRINSREGPLRKRWWAFVFHMGRGNLWPAELLLASQGGRFQGDCNRSKENARLCLSLACLWFLFCLSFFLSLFCSFPFFMFLSLFIYLFIHSTYST